jgi:hypothetical protein
MFYLDTESKPQINIQNLVIKYAWVYYTPTPAFNRYDQLVCVTWSCTVKSLPGVPVKCSVT